MPDTTTRIHIPLPLGNENVTRANYRTALNAIETYASAIADLTAHQTANPADHPAGSITDTHLGTRTVDQTQVASGPTNPGVIGLLISQLANRVRAITGMANWSDTPPVTLSAINTAVTFSGTATTFLGTVNIPVPAMADPLITGQVFIGTGTRTLPAANGNQGRWRYFKAFGGSITINPNGSAGTDGRLCNPGASALNTAGTGYSSPVGESTNWYCDGANWYCI